MTIRNEDESRDKFTKATVEVGERFQEFKSKYDSLHDELASRLDDIELKSGRPGATAAEIDSKLSKAVDTFLRTGDDSVLSSKAATIADPASGGYTHIPQLGPEIISAIGETNPILADCGKSSIDADTLHQVFSVAAAATGRAAESDARGDTAVPVIERVEYNLCELHATPMISLELLESSQFAMEPFLNQSVVDAFNDALEVEFINGDGVKKSKGILANTDPEADDSVRSFSDYQSIETAGSGSISYADIVGLIHSLPLRYRRAAKLYASTDAIQWLRLITDLSDRPLWRDANSGISAAPQSLLGFEVVETPGLPDIAGGAMPIFFGDLMRGYTFVSHSNGLGVLRDLLTTKGMAKFYSRLRCVGGPADTRALKVLSVKA